MGRIFYFDLLRCIAALAVVVIHVLGPYRDLVGQIDEVQWIVAIGLNGVSRWAVPVFLLISGALFVGDPREFEIKYYVKRRLLKVLIPFMVWSLFYAWLSGCNAYGFRWTVMKETLSNALHEATYYHLGFFYYFIPLYFFAPFFQWLVKHDRQEWLWGYVGIWLFTCTAFLFHIDGIWHYQLWLYSGYLPLGYLLAYRTSGSRSEALIAGTIALVCALMTAYEVIQLCLDHGEYTIKRWLSYKTINVIIVASGLFIFTKYIADRIPESSKQIVEFVSKFSLGIYILHPLILWPMQTFEWYHVHSVLTIPLWVIISYVSALALSWLLSRSAFTKWLLP